MASSDNIYETEPTRKQKAYDTWYINLYRKMAIWIVVSKCLAVICFFLLSAAITWYYSADMIDTVRVLLVGLELSLMGIIIFSMIRGSIYVHWNNYTKELVYPNVRVSELLGKIYKDVQRYQNASNIFYNSVRYFKYSTIILAGLSTVLLGLHFETKAGWLHTDYPTFSKNAALVIGTVITIYSSLMAFFNIEKYWLINKTIANKLRSLMDDIEDKDKANKLKDDKSIEAVVTEYKKIKGDFYKYWEGALSDKGTQSNQLNK